MERTLVLVKPDGVQRGLTGEVIRRIECRGLKLIGLKLLRLDRELAARHYQEHSQRPFYGSLIDFITSSPVVAMVWEGPEAVTVVRTMMGATNPAAAAPGTIRGDLALDIGQNVVHGSDGPARAAEEIELYFRPEELVSWERQGGEWIYPEL